MRALIISSLSLTLLGGCGDVGPDLAGGGVDRAPLVGDFADALIIGDLDVRNGTLVGAIGEHFGLHHYATEVRSSVDNHETSVVLIVEGSPSASMVQINVPTSSVDGALPAINIVTCSGPQVDAWTFDQSAEDVTVDMRETDGIVTINYHGIVPNYRAADIATDSDDFVSIEANNVPTTEIAGTLSYRAPSALGATQGR